MKKSKTAVRKRQGKSIVKSSRSANFVEIMEITGNFKFLENKYYSACILDATTLRLVYSNSKLCNLLGFNKREMDKKELITVIHPDDHARMRKAVRNRLHGLPVKAGIRYRLIRKNGSELIAEIITTPISHKEKFYLYTIIRDVTSEVSVESELRESESRFKSFFDLSPEPVFTLNMKGVITSVNKAAEKLTEYKSKSLIGKKLNRLSFWKKKGAEVSVRDCLKVRKKPLECKFISRNGKVNYLELHASKIPPGNNRYEILLIARDITHRKTSEIELKESEQKYKALAENITDGIGIVHKGKYLYVNRKYANIFGYTIQELMGKSVSKVVPMKWKKVLAALEGDLWKGRPSRKSLELDGQKKNGTQIYIDMHASRIRYQDKRALQITVTDMTRRKVMEENLRENEERFRNLVENVQYGFYIMDINTHEMLYLNKHARSLMKGIQDSTHEFNFLNLLSEQDQVEMRKLLKKRKEGKINQLKGKLKLHVSNIKQVIIEYESSVIIHKNRKCIQGIFRDITEFERARLELLESEERFRTIFETAQDSIFIKDRDLKYIHVNPAMESLFNATTKDLIGKSDKEIFGDKEASYIYKSDTRVLSGEIVNEEHSKPVNGNIKTFHIIKVPIHDSSGEIVGLCGIARDITDRKKSAEELYQKQLFLDSIIENIPNMIFIKDARDLKFEYINRAGEEILGYSREKLIGKADHDLFLTENADFFTQKDWEVLKSGKLLDIKEDHIHTPSGKRILHTKKIPLMDERGKPQHLLGISEDITDRYIAEKALLDSEEKYRILIENSSDGIAIVQNNKIIFANKKLLQIYGFKQKSEMEGHFYTDFVIPEFRDKMLDWGNKRERGEYAPIQYEYKGLRKNNSQFDADILVSVFSYKGKPARQAIIRDITSRKKTEKDLIESEEKYRVLVESSADGIVVIQGEIIEYVNDKMLEIFGCESKEDAEGLSFTEFVAPEYREFLIERGQKRTRGESVPNRYEFIGMRKDGTCFDADISIGIIKFKGEYAIQAIVRDITARKWTELALIESEEKFRRVSEQSMLGIYIVQDNQIKFVNDAASKITGISIEEWFDWTIDDAINQVHPDDRNYVLKQSRRQMQGRENIDIHYSFRIITASGKTIWLELFSKPINYGGKSAELIAIIDITDRKEMEEELRNERDFSTDIISGTPAIIVGISPGGITTFVNPAGEQITGYKAKELVGKNWWKIFYPGKESAQVKKLFKAFEKGDVRNFEMTLTTKAKKKRIIAWNSINRLDDKGNLVEIIGFGNDITEKKKADLDIKNQRDMLREVTKDVIRMQEDERRRISMELHDSIGGSLSIIKLQLQNLIKSIQDDDIGLADGLTKISDLVSDTIIYLRQISANLRPVILDNLGLWPTIEWYLKDFGKKTELDLRIDIQGQDIKLDQGIENHLFRIIQEIMINIKSHSEATKVIFKSRQKDSDIIFEISENGRGFDPKRIFDPSVRHSGMGVINIMERVNIVKGTLDIKSAPGKGAKYIISIPVTN